jgi:molybdenum cofactor cytidylyltransferase
VKWPFAAVVLAAGRGTRMIGASKLLAEIDGKPIIRRSVEAAIASSAGRVIVVTGHDAKAVGDALHGLDILAVHNPDYAQGLSTSLRRGIAGVPAAMDAALVMLGDMPFVTPQLIDALSAAQERSPEALIVVPNCNGQRGKPVLWHRSLFAELQAVEGDRGARDLFARHARRLAELPTADDAVLIDIDTAEDLARYARQ